jgi:hypothetical protein
MTIAPKVDQLLGSNFTKQNEGFDFVSIEFLTIKKDSDTNAKISHPAELVSYECSGSPKNIKCYAHEMRISNSLSYTKEQRLFLADFSKKFGVVTAKKDPNATKEFFWSRRRRTLMPQKNFSVAK